MKGSYCLIMKLKNNSKIKVGKLGKLNFEKGYYVYVGSALNSLESRVKRHLSSNKKLHWHIDYFLMYAKILEIIAAISNKRIECEIAKYLNNYAVSIENFGSSDCNCPSHLFYFKNFEKAKTCVKNAFKNLGKNLSL